ncbi:uncharacterized protein LOC123988247 [Osmia bicornis bicornis]|uniref:uncharacterized protein LOC123988247 n=1 Tax=Osmia bicornis bicornis TaxID=1437191 RepID=UPI001EAF18B5|nr:uncharacterized protein LOC123988247 [Osmia bicornis bicornis]
MPPLAKKLVKARRRKSRKNSLRGVNVMFVEDVSGESPSTESSFSLHTSELRLQESLLVPAQSTTQRWGETGGVSISSNSTANNTLRIPSRALPSNMLGSSSDANVHPSNKSSLGSLQPFLNNAIKGVVTIPSKLPKTVEELIVLIKSTFAQSFNLNYTQNELKAVYRRESETIEEYGFRVNDILDRGVQAAKENLNSKEFGEVKKLLMTSAMTGFLRVILKN